MKRVTTVFENVKVQLTPPGSGGFNLKSLKDFYEGMKINRDLLRQAQCDLITINNCVKSNLYDKDEMFQSIKFLESIADMIKSTIEY